MTLENYTQFLQTLENDQPDADWPVGLKSIWYDAVGDWEASHNIAQEMHSNLGNWIHAYLHRKEGDEWNAGYWYRKAKKPFPKYSLEEELEVIVLSIIDPDSN
jgi:hypothetical protein